MESVSRGRGVDRDQEANCGGDRGAGAEGDGEGAEWGGVWAGVSKIKCYTWGVVSEDWIGVEAAINH